MHGESDAYRKDSEKAIVSALARIVITLLAKFTRSGAAFLEKTRGGAYSRLLCGKGAF
jgi:hypothetical protein